MAERPPWMRRVLFTFEDVEWLMAQSRNCRSLGDDVLALLDAREATPPSEQGDVVGLRARVRELENALKHCEAKRLAAETARRR